MAMSNDHSHIPDWGVDLDRRNRPAVPMERTPPRLDPVPRGEPEPQPQTVEVLRSIERPDLTPVFGTSAPPRGVSGWIRRRAFELSENDIRHWLMLMAADRVDVVEGVAEDVGKSPRAKAAIVGVAGASLLALWLMRRRRSGR